MEEMEEKKSEGEKETEENGACGEVRRHDDPLSDDGRDSQLCGDISGNRGSNVKSGTKNGVSRKVIAVSVAAGMIFSAAAGAVSALLISRSILGNLKTVTYVVNTYTKTEEDGGDEDKVIKEIVEYRNHPIQIIEYENSEDEIINAIDNAKDSVVEIATESTVIKRSGKKYIAKGAGSGVIISRDGYIITCDHVITGAEKITVTLTDGRKYEAVIAGEDPEKDIAVIKTDPGEDEITAAFIGDSSGLVLGQTVIAIGNPLGELGGTVTEGIISALDREIEIDGETRVMLQTSAAINPGNSGGGLFNKDGELIGIVSAKSSGLHIEGLGFSIPVNNAMETAEEMIRDHENGDQAD